MGDTQNSRRNLLPLAFGDPDTAADERDPRARWRTMPPPVLPRDWVSEHDEDPVPESVRDAEANRAAREARWLIERGGGLGA